MIRVPSQELTFSVVDEYLIYCAETGKLHWKIKPSQITKAGSEAGCVDLNGYRIVMFKGKSRKAHRLAWMLYYGSWPDGEIDHIDGNRADNRIENLRCVDGPEDAKNRKKRSDNTSGCTGVTWHPQTRKWRVRIRGKRNSNQPCLFASKSEAIEFAKTMHSENGYSIRHQNSM